MTRNSDKSIFMLLALLLSFAGGLFSWAIAETTLVIYTTADSGPGTLRQALLDAINGDTIAFDPTVFPPSSPATIDLTSGVLPAITVSNLTIDASNAGVIIDGSLLGGAVNNSLEILSDGNTVRGLHVTNFSGAGIALSGTSESNTIGPQNTIANNGGNGIMVSNSTARFNTITRNSIYNNAGKGIELLDGGNAELASPVILEFNLEAGTVSGISCPNYIIEIFSDSGDEGEYYEGEATANTRGGFAFNKGTSFTYPHLTATATDTNGNTSEFSTPNSGPKGCKKTLPWLPLLLFDD